MPVSTLRWTGGTAPTWRRTISAISCDVILMLSPWAVASATSPAVRPPRTRTGALISPSRSATPSPSVATPSQAASAARAARQTGTTPCPYASALTTAMSRHDRDKRRRTAWMLRAMAARSTSAHARRVVVSADGANGVMASRGRAVTESRCRVFAGARLLVSIPARFRLIVVPPPIVSTGPDGAPTDHALHRREERDACSNTESEPPYPAGQASTMLMKSYRSAREITLSLRAEGGVGSLSQC